MKKFTKFIQNHQKFSLALILILVNIATLVIVPLLWKGDPLPLIVFIIVISILIWMKEFYDRKYLEWIGTIIFAVVAIVLIYLTFSKNFGLNDIFYSITFFLSSF